MGNFVSQKQIFTSSPTYSSTSQTEAVFKSGWLAASNMAGDMHLSSLNLTTQYDTYWVVPT